MRDENLRAPHGGATISPQASAILAMLPNVEDDPTRPAPDDIASWADVQRQKDAVMRDALSMLASGLKVTKTLCQLDGVPALRFRPLDVQYSDRTIFYVHGGAYTLFTVDTAGLSAALLAHQLSTEVVAIGYSLAPQAKSAAILDEVVRGARALRAEQDKTHRLIGLGDSAGGSLLCSALLAVNADIRSAFAALVLMSPWADIGSVGESYETLAAVEPTYVYHRHLYPSAKAYCPDETMWTDPSISPVYGDFSRDWPPTLIQGGTREIFLSNCVRLYQAIYQASGDARLDLYEGMTHVFQLVLGWFDVPEANAAFASILRFLDESE